MDPISFIALFGFVGSVIAAWLTYRISNRANAVTAVALEADRRVLYYEQVLALAETRLKRMHAQVQLLIELLDKADALSEVETQEYREQLAALRVAVLQLYPELVELRAQLVPPPPAEAG